MRWTKEVAYYLIIALVTVVLLDTVAFLGFRERLGTIFTEYGRGLSAYGRGYPRYYFASDPEMGFDIVTGFRTETSVKPVEYGPYAVWGNAHGCFDSEWNDTVAEGGIYLAGDSFTWGYTAYGSRFADLLEEELATPVYACGVTHTGQRHQYAKFRRLRTQGVRPSVVIVNVYTNDVDNDYFYPHTAVVDGYMVENIEQCDRGDDAGLTFSRVDSANLKQELSEKTRVQPTIRTLLKQYSLTINVAAGMRRWVNARAIARQETRQDCIRSLYSERFSQLGEHYAESPYSAPNRMAIREWIEDSNAVGYQLIFSLIPPKDEKVTMNYAALSAYIRDLGGEVIAFEEFIAARRLDRPALYYKRDMHFNDFGHAKYAQFLASALDLRSQAPGEWQRQPLPLAGDGQSLDIQIIRQAGDAH